MAILIKDMEMPESCGLCKLYHAESPMYCMAVDGHKTVGAPYGMPRPDWCPLVEVAEVQDAVNRQAAIDLVEGLESARLKGEIDLLYPKVVKGLIGLPSAQPERQNGEWILKKKLVSLALDCSPINYDNYDETSHSELREIYCCSECGWESGEFKGGNFCPNCGADMRTKETDYDYERAVDQLEHDILYEPTFNQDDGSM